MPFILLWLNNTDFSILALRVKRTHIAAMSININSFLFFDFVYDIACEHFSQMIASFLQTTVFNNFNNFILKHVHFIYWCGWPFVSELQNTNLLGLL